MNKHLRVLLCVLTLLVGSVLPASAAVALRGSSAGSGTGALYAAGSTTCTFGATAQSGDLIVVSTGWSSNATISSVVDSNAGALTQLLAGNNSGSFVSGYIGFRTLSTTATSITVTLSGNVASDAGIWCAAFTGMATTSINGNIDVNNAGTGATHTTGNVTTTVADGLLLSMISGDTTRTFSTPDPDYTVGLAYTSGSFYTFGADYRILSATETNNHTVVMSAGMASTHGVGELHGAAGGGGGSPQRLLLLGVGEQ